MKYFILLALCAVFIIALPYNKASADQVIDGVMRIKATIIQCGSMDFMNDSCRENQACCHFVDDFNDENLEEEIAEPTGAPLSLIAFNQDSMSNRNESFIQE